LKNTRRIAAADQQRTQRDAKTYTKNFPPLFSFKFPTALTFFSLIRLFCIYITHFALNTITMFILCAFLLFRENSRKEKATERERKREREREREGDYIFIYLEDKHKARHIC